MSDDNVLGASFYLPEINIFNPGSNGVKTVKQFATKCYQDHDTMCYYVSPLLNDFKLLVGQILNTFWHRKKHGK